jgi:hypothetical protein
MHSICIDNDMAKVNLDFTAYLWQDHSGLDPAYLKRCRDYLAQLPRSNPFHDPSSKPQASSDKQQAASKRLTGSKL